MDDPKEEDLENDWNFKLKGKIFCELSWVVVKSSNYRVEPKKYTFQTFDERKAQEMSVEMF